MSTTALAVVDRLHQFIGAALLQPIPVNYAVLLPGAMPFVGLSTLKRKRSKKQCSECQFSRANPKGRPCKKCAERWEKVLASRGLGVDQPQTDHSRELMGEEQGILRNDFLRLRRQVDKGDRFMEAHEIKKNRGLNKNRSVPNWAMDDESVRKILLSTFPKMDDRDASGLYYVSEAQRRKAGRWMRVIYLYYRMRLPRPSILKELQMTDSVFTTLLRDIDRKAKDILGQEEPPASNVSFQRYAHDHELGGSAGKKAGS